MTCRPGNTSPPTLTATEWGLILMALEAYQHHTAYRDLHEKVALLAKAVGSPARGAVSLAVAVSDARGATRLNHRPAVMG